MRKRDSGPMTSTTSASGSIRAAAMTDDDGLPHDELDDATDADPTRRHAIEDLADTAGRTSDDDILLAVGDHGAKKLLTLGASIASARLCNETLRVIVSAQTFLRLATSTQRETLGINSSILALAASACARARHTWRVHNEPLVDRRTEKKAVAKGATSVLQATSAAKQQLAGALRKVFPGNAAMQKRIQRAASPKASGKESTGSGQALHDLVLLARGALKSSDPAVRSRIALWGVTRPKLTKFAAQAKQALDAERALAPQGTASRVTLSEVNRWEGITCVLVQGVIRAFRDAHEIDETIPVLPWGKLKPLLGPRPRRAKKAAPGDAPKVAKTKRVKATAKPEATEATKPAVDAPAGA